MKKIAVLYGWTSSERQVSIKSGKFIYQSIDSSKFQKDYFIFPEDKNKFIENYKQYDLAIPVFHWKDGEDGQIFAFLNTLGIKSLYSDFGSHYTCLNKKLANSMLENKKINTIPTCLCKNINQFDQVDINGKLFIKPNQGGSSIDTWVFDNLDKGRELVQKILDYDDVVVQKYIPIDREFSVTVFGDCQSPSMAGITEIITQRDYFDYQAKYDLKQTREQTPAKVSNNLQKKLKKQSLEVYKTFKLQTISRIDYIYHDNSLFFLEVNTIPGFTDSSLSPQALRQAGFSIQDFFTQQIKEKIGS